MNILFVCTGNTCRSPMAEGYLKHKNKNIYVKSAGIYADSSPVSANSAAAMKDIGIDISSHFSIQLTKNLLNWADKIYCMSDSHLQLLSGIADNGKLFLLGNGISDPFGQDISEYTRCRDEIIKEIDLLFPDMKVRKSEMKADDAAYVAELEKICFSAPWSATVLEESAKNGTTFFIAEANGDIAGYIGIDTVLDEGYITNIAVFPEHRKKGIASALLAHTENFAKENKLSFITLEVRVSNSPAIKLYEKHGFETAGKRKNFYINPTEDALILTKRF